MHHVCVHRTRNVPARVFCGMRAPPAYAAIEEAAAVKGAKQAVFRCLARSRHALRAMFNGGARMEEDAVLVGAVWQGEGRMNHFGTWRARFFCFMRVRLYASRIGVGGEPRVDIRCACRQARHLPSPGASPTVMRQVVQWSARAQPRPMQPAVS